MNEPLPPPTRLDDEQRASLQLSLLNGIGPRLFSALVEHFGSAQAVLRAGPQELQQVAGVGPKLARTLVVADSARETAALETLCREQDIRMCFRQDADYPRVLKEIPDPPNVLFVQGSLQPGDQLALAIVGSRHATHYGIQTAERLARGLSLAGLTIVSGLARGIDQAAHRGALAAGGRTLAVLGSGVLNIYPPEHDQLARDVMAQGALLSEFHPQQAPRGSAFPQRNRIISGLSLGTLVIEAGERSGALISARMASEQGRDVLAVPGRIDSRMSRGCHQLIRDGARLVQSVEDVLEELGPLVAPVKTGSASEIRHPAELRLNDRETAVLQAIETQPTAIDDIVIRTQLPVQQVLATISVLEIRHLVRRINGATLIRN